MATRTVLLNPGPVNLSERTRAAMSKPDLCHREADFARLQSDIRSALLRVSNLSDTTHTCVLLSGSGTLAVEAMISSLVPRDGKVLVLANGIYGERMGAIVSAHAIPASHVTLPWGEPIDPAAVETALRSDPHVTHVTLVHHETTTGRLNTLPEVGRLCAEFGKSLLIDAVSSFGADALDFRADHITACAVSANKCLHGAPGLAFVIGARETLEQSKGVRRSVYMDLHTHWIEQESGSCAFTPAVHLCYALDEALREFSEQGGQPARHKVYLERATLIRRRLEELGVQRYLTSGPLASSLTAFHLPKQTSYQMLHDRLRESGFVIYAGQGGLSQKIFRIANMGDITAADLDKLFEALNRVLCVPSS